ncbi:uncharacterized protein LOC133285733 isoform X1 [Gastrolobium bilobum]|uniref:uncharacterized protein LOC133285733 isoform X1 n=1 Tax=Gastrolobium bilobum TaxID=150636 RepID=UPI002AB20E92|nr:uncharacterized protein LOC133285733 isoform X1 [Gastrolobium bilobum]
MEFFSFSGDIEYVELQSHDERSQIAYVTFKDSQGAETAVLLSGATIVDLSVNITPDPDYRIPATALASSTTVGKTPGGAESALWKAKDVVTNMLAKGFILGKDAVNKAKTFDEKLQITSTASAKLTSFDQKLGLSEKISAGASVVSDRVREVDQKFQVSEKTKSAFAVAEQKVSTAGSAIMKNRYVLTGTSWVTGAFNRVAKAAGDVGQKTKEKVENAEEEHKRKVEDQFAQVLSESPKAAIKSIKVSNVSVGASERDIMEFFSFSGDIEYVELQSHDEQSQIAYVTFKDSQGAETAVLLSGATIVDLSVNITLDPDYRIPATALASSTTVGKTPGGAESALRKAKDVVTSMLAKGFILVKDAVNKAKTFDEKLQITSTASAKLTSFDQKLGLSEKISAGASVVSDRVREVDQKFQVSEKTKSAFAVAEQKVSTAGSAIMKNRYVLTGTSWVTGAFNRVAKAAGDVGQKTKERVENTEEEQKRKVEDHQYAQVLSKSPKAAVSELHSSKPAPAQGLIL